MDHRHSVTTRRQSYALPPSFSPLRGRQGLLTHFYHWKAEERRKRIAQFFYTCRARALLLFCMKMDETNYQNSCSGHNQSREPAKDDPAFSLFWISLFFLSWYDSLPSIQSNYKTTFAVLQVVIFWFVYVFALAELYFFSSAGARRQGPMTAIANDSD